MKRNLLNFFFIITTILSNAQSPAIEWQAVYGGDQAEVIRLTEYTSDGGAILTGYSYSSISGNKTENGQGNTDYWIVKIDASGIIQWQNTIGGSGFDFATTCIETPDAGFLIGGYSGSGISGDKSESVSGTYDYWVVKLNSSGAIEWQNTIKTNQIDMMTASCLATDGGYIIAGQTSGGISIDKTSAGKGLDDIWILKLNNTGSIVWQKSYGGNASDLITSISPTADGGYIVGAHSISGISGDKTENSNGGFDLWILKLNALGNLEWQSTIGGDALDNIVNINQTNDGGYIVGTYSSSSLSGDKSANSRGDSDYWILKLDASANIIWQTTIGGSGKEVLTEIEETETGHFILYGYSNSNSSGEKTENLIGGVAYGDVWMMEINNTGSILWQNTIGGTSDDITGSFGYNATDGILAGAYSISPVSFDKIVDGFGNYDYWILQFEHGCIPTGDEVCNELDDDCNGLVDDGISETIMITADGATEFCQGETVLLTATFTGESVQWKRNGVNIPGATGSSYLVNKKGNYTCITISDCDETISNSINVIVNKNPTATITADGPISFCAGGSVTLNVTPVPGSTYQWYKGAAMIAGATSTSYVATTAGNYKCRVTRTATGCFKNSNPIAVTVPCKEGEITPDVSVFPNPAGETLHVVIGNMENCTIKIYTMSGQLVYEGNELTIDISHLASEMYTIVISGNQGVHVSTFVKQG